MTDKEINIEIAKIAGWKIMCHPDVMKIVSNWTNPDIWALTPQGGLTFIYDIPDYTGDLNAINEIIEKIALTESEWDNYYGYLYQLTIGRRPVCESDYRDAVDASARQRAEAFLRAIGRWKE